MTQHLFGAIVTPHAVASNNRGENEGNTTTLQKLLWNGDVHTTVSAEAIRFAMRTNWQAHDLDVNRRWDETARRHNWQDGDFAQGGTPYIDDDVLGYMSAQAAKEEAAGEADEAAPAQRRGRARGTALIRRSRFETTRAVSVTPWFGDVVFNVASINATPSASRAGGGTPVPYSAEVHAARYQYAFALTPEHLLDTSRSLPVIDAIIELSDVAGSQARYFYDFAPDTVIFRWTDDPAPRILYPFRVDDAGVVSVPELLRRIRGGDIEPGELVVGGSISEMPDGEALRQLGATVHLGVKAAASEIKDRLSRIGGA